MAEGRIVKTMKNCELELPETIIEHIQSFLTRKEAAQTTTLSKSWHKAWLTRPHLDLDESDFNEETYKFLNFAKKTMQRYENSYRKIESLRLRMQYSYDGFAKILIVKALKLGASHLSLECHSDRPRRRCKQFNVAQEVFESENLVELSIKSCGVYVGMDHKVRCCKLENLSLSSVKMESRVVISNIISSCPLIQNLSLSYLYFEKEKWRTSSDRVVPINLHKLHNLKRVSLCGVELDTLFLGDMSSNFPSLKDLSLKYCTIESNGLDSVHTESHMISKIVMSCPSIENLSLFSVHKRPAFEAFPIKLPKLHNLKCLALCLVKLDSLFFDNLPFFPALKYLTLDSLYRKDDLDREEEEIRISSRSLEHLDLFDPHYRMPLIFKLEVPSIQKFVIEASWSIPKVSFESTSEEEWESHVSINFSKERNPLHNASFLMLNELLTSLSPSKIHLSAKSCCETCFDYEVRDIQGLPKPRVENLTVDIQFLPSLNCYALFDGLFRICRPKFITQILDPRTRINDFLYKRLDQGRNGEFSSPWSFLYGLHDLKEVYVQFFEDLPWKPLIESSEICLELKRKIRFQLVWKS